LAAVVRYPHSGSRVKRMASRISSILTSAMSRLPGARVEIFIRPPVGEVYRYE
jgi:hypothetical protein